MAPYTDDHRLCLLTELDLLVGAGITGPQSVRHTHQDLKARLQILQVTNPGFQGYMDWGDRRIESCFRKLEAAYRVEFQGHKRALFDYGTSVLNLDRVFEDRSYVGRIISVFTLQEAITRFRNAANATNATNATIAAMLPPPTNTTTAVIPLLPATAAAASATFSTDGRQNGAVGLSTDVGILRDRDTEAFAARLDDLLVACNVIVANMFTAVEVPEVTQQAPSPCIPAVIAVFIITAIMEADLQIDPAISHLVQVQNEKIRHIQVNLGTRIKLSHSDYQAAGPTFLAEQTNEEVAAVVENLFLWLGIQIRPLVDQSGASAPTTTWDTFNDQLRDLVALAVLDKYRKTVAPRSGP
ncbi:hypothetical protein MMC11_002743 [Xylographa trunciseda]|nr:hypothetical protein [Xylographa trunciseda]